MYIQVLRRDGLALERMATARLGDATFDVGVHYAGAGAESAASWARGLGVALNLPVISAADALTILFGSRRNRRAAAYMRHQTTGAP